MFFNDKKGKQSLLLAFVLITVGACKQSEFYDKAALLEPAKAVVSKPGTDNGQMPPANDVNNGTVPNPPSSVVIPPPVVVNPPVDCSGFWSECSKSCGGGTQKFTITISTRDGGHSCTAKDGDLRQCNLQECPIGLIDRSEIFTQNKMRDGDVDILFMIDNSGSMENKQKRLSESLGIFIDKFLDKNINFKMGITTTDGTNRFDGKIVGDPNKLTSNYLKQVGKATFMAYFQSITKVGILGSGIEQGLKTSAAFFDRYRSSFLRDDAYLTLVEISDEDDQSEKSVSDYVSYYQSLKKNKGMVKIYSIVTQTLPDDHTLQDSIGNRYMQASKMSGGTSSEIKDDFSKTLNDLGTNIVNLVDSFSLAEAAYNSEVTVLVNNKIITSGWKYNDISHSIKFDASSVPTEGSKIEVRYHVKASVVGAN